MSSAQTKVNAALLYKSIRKSSVATLEPPSLVAGGADSYPNLPKGIVHLRHWLTLNLTVNVANANTAATVAGGTASPNGALDYLQQIYYSANNISKFIVLTGAQAFKIGMWQMGIDTSVNAAHTSIFQNDEIFSIPAASIPASGSTNFTASIRIPINFSGTHTATPNLIGFSTLNPSITTFEINAQFGTVSSMISGLAAGVTASITSATLSLTAEYYPPNYFPIRKPTSPCIMRVWRRQIKKKCQEWRITLISAVFHTAQAMLIKVCSFLSMIQLQLHTPRLRIRLSVQ